MQPEPVTMFNRYSKMLLLPATENVAVVARLQACILAGFSVGLMSLVVSVILPLMFVITHLLKFGCYITAPRSYSDILYFV
jgi:hypothetical protein